MIGPDADVVLPEVRPKGFNVSSGDVPASSLGRSKSKSLGLSLRRITPDRRGGNSGAPTRPRPVVIPPSPPSRARKTAKSPKKKSPGRAKSSSIERQQKMEDEYYRPSMHWAEDDEDENEGEEGGGEYYSESDEDLDDGELPSLRRVDSRGSGGPASPTSRWRAANRDAAATGSGNAAGGGSGPGTPSRAAMAAAAAASAVVIAAPRQPPAVVTPEQLKVAGFWSQLDDTDDLSSDDGGGGGGPGAGAGEDDSADEEDQPEDERRWRRSMSPPRDRRGSRAAMALSGAAVVGVAAAVGAASGAPKKKSADDASIGLDLIRPDASDYDDDETKRESDAKAKKKNEKSGWNLLEKAACYANDRSNDEDEEEDESLRTSKNNDPSAAGGANYAGAMMDEEDDDTYDQSLDRTFQTAATGDRTGASRTATLDDTLSNTRGGATKSTGGGDEEEDNGVLACITVALATMCGYEAYDAAKEGDKRKRAHEIIEKRKKRSADGASVDGETDGAYYDDGMSDEEDTAIELQYHPTVDVASPPGSPGGSPKKKKKSKGFKKFLRAVGLKSKKEEDAIENPRKTLVTTTTRTGREPPPPLADVEGGEGSSGDGGVPRPKTRVTDMYSSMTFEQEILGEEEGEEGGGEAQAADGKVLVDGEGEGATASKKATKLDDDEQELESEAAGWSANKKNTYLRQLAERAKMDYAAKDQGGGAAAGEDDKKSKSSGPSAAVVAAAAVGAVVAAPLVGAAVVGAAAVNAASSRSLRGQQQQRVDTDDYEAVADDDDRDEEDADGAEEVEEEEEESTLASIPHKDTGVPEGTSSTYHTDYNSLNPAEKRAFLRLLNSGMNPKDAARAIAMERDGGGGGGADDRDVVAIVEEEDEDDVIEEEEEEEEDDGTHVTDGPGEGPVTLSSRQPYDESVHRAASTDPPGGTLAGVGSGESAELSTKEDYHDDDEDGEEGGAEASASRSEAAQHGSGKASSSSGRGKYAALAAIPLVPAIVRAKSRSKSKDRRQDRASAADDAEDGDGEVRHQTVRDATAPALAPDADGLLSSGIGYYDARGRGLDPNEKDHDDDGLLDGGGGAVHAAHAPSSRGRSRKARMLGPAAAVSGIAAKVASSRNQGGGAYVSANYDHDAKSDASAGRSSGGRALTGALGFRKIGGVSSRKQWSKLDSDAALDRVAPSRSAEVEDVPSWLVSRDEDEEEHTGGDNEDEVEDEPGEVKGEEGEPTAMEEEAEDDQSTEMWSPSLSPEMEAVPRRRNVVTPTSPDYVSTPGTNYENDDVASPQESNVDSLALSPGSQDEDEEVEDQEEEEEKKEERAEDASNAYASPRSPQSQFSSGISPTGQPDEDASSYASTATGSTWTAASKPHRRRHKGAASKRLHEAKQAAGTKSKGWLDSIRDAASTQGQVWDPERGWVDYTEPEVKKEGGSEQHQDLSPIGSLRLAVPAKRTRRAPEEQQQQPSDASPRAGPVDFENERDAMVKSDGEQRSAMETDAVSETKEDEDSVFDAMTVNTMNTAAGASSVYSGSTVPKRRSAPRHRPTDRRKIGAAEQTAHKPIGWKESMESATANVAKADGTGRRWDYERGWVNADGSVDDDVSELTRSTLEGVKLVGHSGSSPSGSNVGEGADDRRGDASPAAEAEETSAPLHRLPSVAEEVISDADSTADDGEPAGEDNGYVERNSDIDESYEVEDIRNEDVGDNASEDVTPRSRGIALPSLGTVDSGSDKENEVSVESASNATPPQQVGDQRPPAPLPANNNKRSLNTWLEKANQNASSNQMDESRDAAVLSPGSNKAVDSSSASPASLIVQSNRNNQSQGRSEASPFHFSDDDPFGENFTGAQNVKVVKEKCSDADSDLFEPSNIGVSKSLMKKIATKSAAAVHQERQLQQQVVVEPVESHESDESDSWAPPAPMSSEKTSVSDNDADDDDSVSARARAWMTSVEKRTQEQGDSDLDSNAPQVNKTAADANQGRSDPPQSLDPPSASASYIGTRNAKKASDSWIRSRKELDDDDEGGEVSSSNEAAQNTSFGSLRAKFERKDKEAPAAGDTAKQPVFVPMKNDSEENDVYFRSNAMGIRLKRGEDGFVRVVSVTEATTGSSIVRDGAIEPEDIIMEAAGVDLRKPITNSQWGETVTKIRNAPRPMKFVVSAGPKRKTADEVKKQSSPGLPPPPAKFVMESRLSKSPEGQEVLESISQARGYNNQTKSAGVHRTKAVSSQTSVGETDDTVGTKSTEEEETYQDPRKESIFKRITSGCTSPASACAVPNNQSHAHDQDDGSQVPMAHLQFLRTNPTIARVTNAASRRYPAFCGRPDTIYEEPDDDDTRDTRTSGTKERGNRPSYGMARTRSAASSTYDGSQTMMTLSTYDDGTKTTYDKSATVMSSASTGSIGSGSGAGDNTAFLEKIALNSAVASKPTRSKRNEVTMPGSFGKATYGSSQQRSNDLEWPDDDERPKMQGKETIDNASTYSSNTSHSAFQGNDRKKKDTARQAELLAAAKVEDMMSSFDADPDSTSEI